MNFDKLKINKEKIKNISSLLLSKSRTIILTIVTIISISVFIFLYHNFYLTITSTKKINGLQNELDSNRINKPLLEEIESNITKKISQPDKNWEKFVNLFKEKINTTTLKPEDIKPKSRF